MKMTATKAQARMLDNAANGRPLRHGIKGQSAHGGATATWFSLRQRKWLDEKNQITETGRAALSKHEEEQL